MNFIDLGNVIVDLDKLLFVERGRWNQSREDFEAILIMTGGVKCEPGLHIQEVRAKIVNTGLCLTGGAL